MSGWRGVLCRGRTILYSASSVPSITHILSTYLPYPSYRQPVPDVHPRAAGADGEEDGRDCSSWAGTWSGSRGSSNSGTSKQRPWSTVGNTRYQSSSSITLLTHLPQAHQPVLFPLPAITLLHHTHTHTHCGKSGYSGHPRGMTGFRLFLI